MATGFTARSLGHRRPTFGPMRYSASMGTLLNWNNLRPHLGDLRSSFEALIAAMAEWEFTGRVSDGWRFIRNGRPDGGVECFWQAPEGDQHAFQAKFFTSALGPIQWRQLDESFEQAFSKYPRLKSFTVCMPLELPHSPASTGKTSREKWEATRTRWEEKARRSKRQISVELWDGHALLTRLSTQANEGLVRFFFDASVLTADSVRLCLDRQIAYSGMRYQPTLHVEVEPESAFDWLVHSEPFRNEKVSQLREAQRLLRSAFITDYFDGDAAFGKARAELEESLRAVEICMGSSGTVALDPSVESALEKWWIVNSAFHNLENRRRGTEDSTPENDARIENAWRSMRPVVELLREQLRWLGDARERSYSRLCDQRAALLTGKGGCGKTHLLCRIAEKARDAGFPVILALGQQLSVQSLWHSLYSLVGAFSSREEFLGALDAAGQRAGCRALLIIDALNEADDNSRWASELRSLLKAIEPYRNIALALSVRDGYVDVVVPEKLKGLMRLHHYGFMGHQEEALVRYFTHYNIARPDVPALHPEFESPLFLSVFCRALAGSPDPEYRRAPLAFPAGIDGFSRLFDAFLDHLERNLHERFELDRDRGSRPLAIAIRDLASLMGRSGNLEVGLAECADVLKKHITGKRFSGNLVGLLESEGLLLRVARRESQGTLSETVQFAYDRMGAHFVVESWLEGQVTGQAAWASLKREGALKKVLTDTKSYGRAASIAEALHMHWMERLGCAIFDTRPQLAEIPAWCGAFINALSLVPRASVPQSLPKWLPAALGRAKSERRASVILPMLTRIGNPRLVGAVHEYLASQPLAARDAWWTVSLARAAGGEYVEALTTWPLERRISRLAREDAVACATALAWITTTTVEWTRARATKAIAAVLEDNLEAVPALLARFKDVNDPYVLESISLAIYGACIRSADAQAVRQAGECVLTLYPKKSLWPVHLIARHALAGIVEIAIQRNPGWKVDLRAVTPPYGTKLPREVPSWQSIDRLVRSAMRAKRFAFPNIVSSCTPVSGYPGKMYGDFGRYIVSCACHDFFPSGVIEERAKRPFTVDFPHRFIIGRVLQMGWTSKRFEEFDRQFSSGGRGDNSTERIGKKYQWIALMEFLARATDQFPIPDSDRRGWDPRGPYTCPWQLLHHGLIDTSLLRVKDRDARDRADAGWWMRADTGSFWDGPENEWLLHDRGFPDPRPLLIQRAPDGSGPWTMLCGYGSWMSRDPAEGEEADGVKRRIWMHFYCSAVRCGELARLRKWARRRHEQHLPVPEPPHFMNSLFGELYWSRGIRHELGPSVTDPWLRAGRGSADLSCPMLRLAAQYVNEADPSFGSSLYALVPGPWVVDKLGLRAGPEDLVFTDRHGTRVCWSPSADGGGNAVFCNLSRLSDAAERDGLSLIWLVIGEKNVLAGHGHDSGPLSPRFRGLYWLEQGTLKGQAGVDFDEDFRAGRPRKYPKPIPPVEIDQLLERIKKTNQRSRKRGRGRH
jgi:hypothetical protein